MAIKIKNILSVATAAAMTLSLFVMPVAEAAKGTSDGWKGGGQGGADATITLDNTEAFSGEYSLKCVNRTASASNVYAQMYIPVSLTANVPYRVSVQVKSEASDRLQAAFSFNGRQTLTAYGNTFDWRNFEWVYTPTTTGEVNFQILVDGISKGVWIDDVKIIDPITGKNLVKNSTFEEVLSNTVTEIPDELINATNATDDTVLALYNKVSTSDSYTEEEMQKVRGAFKFMPVYTADNIIIDGNYDDWNSYPEMVLPTLPTQYNDLSKDGLPKDNVSISKFAYDGEKFYLYIEVTDNVYVSYSGENEYWKGDSIQLAISSTDEAYGSELGLRYNPETGLGEIYGTGFTADQKKEIDLVAFQNGNKTIYELSIPWYLKYNNRPVQLYFNYLINDNDGTGRRYCAELAPLGISKNKTNIDCPLLEMFDTQNSWYGWIEGDRKGETNSKITYNWYLVNSNDEAKTFTVKNTVTNQEESFKVPAHTGIRREVEAVYENAGIYNVGIEFECDGSKMESVTKTEITRQLPTPEIAMEIQGAMVSKAAEIKELIDRCESKEISVDYETVNWRVMDRFTRYIAEDVEIDDLTRIYYTEEVLNELYEESKANLTAYLSGEKTPLDVPRYVTSDITFKGVTAYATNEYKGELVLRPTFFVGYGHGAGPRADVHIFNEFGANTTAQEIGPNRVMTPLGWTKGGGGDGVPAIEKDDVFEGRKAFKISYTLEKLANRFTTVYYTVDGLEGGKEYTLKGWAKGENANGVWVSCNNWDKRVTLPGTYDWKEFTSTVTVPVGSTSAIIRIGIDEPTTKFMLDGMTLTDADGKNYFESGNFEDFDKFNFSFDLMDKEGDFWDQLITCLEKAEANNVAVSVLVSPHYFFDNVINAMNIGMAGAGGGTLRYNINDPRVRKIFKEYLGTIIPIIVSYDSVANICLTNEPHFYVETASDGYYLEPWREFLAEKYDGSIEKLNSVWDTDYSSFAECDFTGYANNVAKKYDYKEFNDSALGEFHQFLADTIHEYAPDMPVSSKIMMYTNNSPSGRDNNGTGYLYNYKAFDLNGSDAFTFVERVRDGGLVQSMWYDYQRSYMEVPVINTEDHVTEDGNLDYRRDAADYMAQTIYQGAIHGRYMSDIWVWERYRPGRSTSFIGSVLHRPDAVAQIGKMTLDLNRLSYYIEALQNEIPEVAIVYSDAELTNNMPTQNATYQTYAAGVYNGKVVRFITDAHPEAVHNYKLIVVPGTKYISSEMLGALNDYVNDGGKVMILGKEDEILTMDKRTFLHDVAIVENIKSKAHIVDYSGTASKILNMTEEEYQDIFRNELKGLGIYYVSVIDVETGKPVTKMEYDIGVEEGKVIISLANYDEAKNVKVLIGGKTVEKSFELRTQKEQGEIISVEKFNPVILEIETEHPFFDVFGHWGESYVAELYKNGIINGRSESRFDPNGTITRWEFHALVSRAAGFELDEYDSESESFRPDDKITREEMCEMLVKFYEKANGVMNADSQPAFADISAPSDFVKKAVNAGLMEGREDGTFDLYGNATRAEASTVVLRFLGE